ncbi:MAG: AAA family ATPase [Verrucomicrobiota bacterium]
MKIEGIGIRGFKCYENLELQGFGPINVFTGDNNSGKSTIIRAIYAPQMPEVLDKRDIRSGNAQITIDHFISESKRSDFTNSDDDYSYISQIYDAGGRSIFNFGDSGVDRRDASAYRQKYPENAIFPIFSRRNILKMEPTTGGDSHIKITGNFQNLPGKFDFLNSGFDGFEEFNGHVKNILGFKVSTIGIPGKQGKQIAYRIDGTNLIPIDSMGDGVPHIIGLLIDLCIAKEKVFVIEEIENDLHPTALKKLLDLIIEKSADNQFFLTTHSNIVLKKLGGVEKAEIYEVSNEIKDSERGVPTSSVIKLQTPEDRQDCLERLGHSVEDYGLWKAWLFLEESSAERIIRDHLLRWFCPELSGLIRTYSADGLSQVEKRFNSFNSLFVFLHLEPTYRNKAWVLIDGGDDEGKVIERLKETYKNSSWCEENFLQLGEHDFERYYPSAFENEVVEVLEISDKQKKRKSKKLLLEKVMAWIGDDDKRAKSEFEKSASEVISILNNISKEVVNSAD